jgi:two-component system, OmpR family, sensor kinase
MSLRARLALLYTAIVGGILLILGAAVYTSVSYTLLEQLDDRLWATAQGVYPTIRVNPLAGDITLDPQVEADLSTDIFIQLWRGGTLRFRSSNLPATFVRPLDEGALSAPEPVFRSVQVGQEVQLRVLTLPLVTSGSRIVAVMQIATNLAAVTAAQETLLRVLVLGVAISMFIAGIAGWVSTEQALAPLDAVTQAALQITRADDLSRRIPYHGPPQDEIGQLITAFNQTLGRLENLFVTQRRFLADVGHELRTPLTVIKGNVDLMRRMGSSDEESLASIETEVDRLTRLVGDLLLLAQAESGKLPMIQQVVELDTLVLEAMGQLNILARGRLQMRLGEIDQVLVCGDPDRLKQVVVNLISNAIHYTPNGGEVLVGLAKQDQRARLTVSDTGPGIAAEDIPHIFERFYRGEKARTRSREGKGFGLGLSIAYWIVRNHGGQIDVAAREPKGTTFCVWLPLAEDDCGMVIEADPGEGLGS